MTTGRSEEENRFLSAETFRGRYRMDRTSNKPVLIHRIHGARPLTKATVATLVVGLALLAVSVPVFIAIRVAHSQGLDAERDRVTSYAQDALHRAVGIADQTDSGIAQLRAFVGTGGDPCSADALHLMQALDLSSKSIQAFGAISGNVALCASLGGPNVNLDIGPPDFTTPAGVNVRTHVTFDFDPKRTVYVVIEQHGFGAIVHRDLAIDVTDTESGVALAVFSYPSGDIDASRGRIEKSWVSAAIALVPKGVATPQHRARTFTDGEQLVSVVTSSRRFLGAVSAISTNRVDDRARQAALLLVPLGVVAGLVLAGAVLYLARLQLALPAVLRTALRRKEFFLVYQPVVDLRTGQWVGAEALVRWRRSNGELVRPDLFVPVVEDSGLSRQFTSQIAELASRDLARLAVEHPEFYIAINVTAADLHTVAIVELFRDLMAGTGVRRGNLVVEATERGFLDMGIARGVVQQLRELGARVLIDDFGTGYSSLSYLESFDIDGLKIDKAFVDTLGTSAATSHVVSHIIEMAKALDLEMVAEGVEHEAQAEALRNQGVQYAQGWLYSAGISFEDLLIGLGPRGSEAAVPPPAKASLTK